jgi:hypothetical protein
MGDLPVLLSNIDLEEIPSVLEDVLHAPSLNTNLFSVTTAFDKGNDVHMYKDEARIIAGPESNSYRAVACSLVCRAVNTRPDIAYSVNVLARRARAPMGVHMRATERVLRYLKSTMELGLFYPSVEKKVSKSALVDCCDASWLVYCNFLTCNSVCPVNDGLFYVVYVSTDDL